MNQQLLKIGLIFLGVIAIGAMAGGVAIVLVTEKTVPDFIISTVSTSVGALAALLVAGRSTNGQVE